jgi:hypothetical protein
MLCNFGGNYCNYTFDFATMPSDYARAGENKSPGLRSGSWGCAFPPLWPPVVIARLHGGLSEPA